MLWSNTRARIAPLAAGYFVGFSTQKWSKGKLKCILTQKTQFQGKLLPILEVIWKAKTSNEHLENHVAEKQYTWRLVTITHIRRLRYVYTINNGTRLIMHIHDFRGHISGWKKLNNWIKKSPKLLSTNDDGCYINEKRILCRFSPYANWHDKLSCVILPIGLVRKPPEIAVTSIGNSPNTAVLPKFDWKKP